MRAKRDRACTQKALTFCALIKKLIIHTLWSKSVTRCDTVSQGRGHSENKTVPIFLARAQILLTALPEKC